MTPQETPPARQPFSAILDAAKRALDERHMAGRYGEIRVQFDKGGIVFFEDVNRLHRADMQHPGKMPQ